MDFLLELLTEEIPARMQPAAAAQLAARFGDGIRGARLPVGDIRAFVTSRRLGLYVTGVGDAGDEVTDERRGPRANAPEAAIAGFVKSTGVPRDQLEERDTPKGRFLYATVVTPGRSAAAILAELIPAIVAAFDWPKSMRWGAASRSTASPRWVRPLTGIVALLGGGVVPFTAAGVASGRTTFGHRFLSAGPIEVASAATYADQLRAAHVVLDPAEREAIIVAGAEAAAAAAGLSLVPDPGLVAENAGLTEWPVPLLGRFDPAYLAVPREIVQLTMRANQKYFACVDGSAGGSGGALAPAFVCVANLDAADGGEGIVAGNRKVLAARLADARFFWDADVARVKAGGLASFTPKLADVVFHEKLGTVADKVERVARLARWLVESGAVKPILPARGEGNRASSGVVEGRAGEGAQSLDLTPLHHRDGDGPPPRAGEDQEELAALAEQAARLSKADLVSATVGEFPELQGIIGGHLASVEGLDPRVAAAIRDHYKPVGPSDTVPTDPVTVAVALADKLDTLVGFYAARLRPSGSRDPFALRRAAIGIIATMLAAIARSNLSEVINKSLAEYHRQWSGQFVSYEQFFDGHQLRSRLKEEPNDLTTDTFFLLRDRCDGGGSFDGVGALEKVASRILRSDLEVVEELIDFLADRLKVQQREAGIRPDVIDAVFSLGGEDDLVRLVARARALQAVLHTPDGASLLAGYRRGANIVRIEEAKEPGISDGEVDTALLTEPAEIALAQALDAAEPQAAAAVVAEDFTAAMTALARLRPAVDAFFDHVTVNSAIAEQRRNRLRLLARLRTAVHTVADFSKLQD